MLLRQPGLRLRWKGDYCDVTLKNGAQNSAYNGAFTRNPCMRELDFIGGRRYAVLK